MERTETLSVKERFSGVLRARWFAIVVVIVPLFLGFTSSMVMSVVSRVAGHEVTDGAVEVSGLSLLFTMGGSFAVIALIIVAGTQRFPIERRRYEPWPLTVASACMAAGIVSGAFEPSTGVWTMLAVLAPVALVAGAAGRSVALRMLPRSELPVSRAPAPAGVLRHGTPSNHAAVWTGRAPTHGRRTWIWIGPYIGVCAANAVFVVSTTGSILVAVAGGVSVLASVLIVTYRFRARRVRVTIGPSGFALRNGVSRRVYFEVTLDHIASARYTLTPKPSWLSDYGKTNSATRLSYLTRAGHALMVKLTDGTDVVVSLDDPEEPAGVLNDLLDQRAWASAPS